MSAVAIAAAEYASRGWPVLPLMPSSKKPAIRHGKNAASAEILMVRDWFPNGTSRNIGIVTGSQSGLLVVDIDPRNGGEESFARLLDEYGELPETLEVETGGGGRHFYLSFPSGIDSAKDRPNVAGFKGVDLKANGYVVAPPSIHPDTGQPYRIASDVPIADAPKWLVEMVLGQQSGCTASSDAATIEEGGRNDTLFRKACSLQAHGWSEEAILAAIQGENAAKCAPPLDADEVERIVQSAMRYEPNTALPFTELGNARRLVLAMDGNARYQPQSKCWMVWDDRQWKRDEDGVVQRMAKEVTDKLLLDAKKFQDTDGRKKALAFARKSQSASQIRSMIELARTEPGLMIAHSKFDAHPNLLNVANGIVDLKTGELRPHDRELYLTHLLDIEYEASDSCPNFDRFVSEVLSGDAELIEYVRRAIGYTATGETREQCFFILYGDGANGKSTFLNSVRDVLGSYGKQTPTDTLVSRPSAASNDLARLAGARFVTASEANADQTLADALVKQMTGGEPIAARFLYCDFFEFTPAFKLFLATNHLPKLNGNDPAMWRRIRTIPFERVFTPEEQDRDLAEKLKNERSGILSWIVQGAVDWYAQGLPNATAIEAANEAYRVEMDTVGCFIEERCDVAPSLAAPTAALFASYRIHANDNGVEPVSQRVFGRALTDQGFASEKRGGVAHRSGLRLKQGKLGDAQ